jgi:hypothetical protein
VARLLTVVNTMAIQMSSDGVRSMINRRIRCNKLMVFISTYMLVKTSIGERII